MKKIFYIFIILALSTCKEDKDNEPVPIAHATPYTIAIPKGFPTNLNIPADNPMTVEGIELGRLLFYDGRLSGRTDTLMSCASCHKQKYAFEAGMETTQYSNKGKTFGVTGIPTPHYMLPLINLVWNSSGYLWNGKIYPENPDRNYRNIEDLGWMGVVAPHEMHGDTNKTKAMIQSIAMYPPMFKKAFGSDIVTMKNIGKAIAQFIRTLISANSKFDKYIRGEVNLTDSERQGFSLFVTETGADCFHCHGSDGNPLFTTHLFYNNGKDSCVTGSCEDKRDRFNITFNPVDHGSYRAPTLRNIELTAPYMHDGRYKTLDEVINFYNSGLKWSPYISPLMHHINTNGVQLTYSKRQDLKAFLLTLTDHDFINNSDFSNPRPDDPYFIKE
jgi:cytochrome c peroxidase